MGTYQQAAVQNGGGKGSKAARWRRSRSRSAYGWLWRAGRKSIILVSFGRGARVRVRGGGIIRAASTAIMNGVPAGTWVDHSRYEEWT
jgi:hypothetical protein